MFVYIFGYLFFLSAPTGDKHGLGVPKTTHLL